MYKSHLTLRKKFNSNLLIDSRENWGYTLENSMFQDERSCHTFDARRRPHIKMGRQVHASSGTFAASIKRST